MTELNRYTGKPLARPKRDTCRNFGARLWLLKHMPDFCWMTSLDLLAMMEIEHPEVEQNLVKATLCNMRANGEVITKLKAAPHHSTGPQPWVYLRVSKTDFR